MNPEGVRLSGRLKDAEERSAIHTLRERSIKMLGLPFDTSPAQAFALAAVILHLAPDGPDERRQYEQ